MKCLKVIPALTFLLFLSACDGMKPFAPTRPVSFTVTVPIGTGLNPSLLGSASNSLLYVLRNASGVVTQGYVGPFASGVSFGIVNFTVDNVNIGNATVLSVQLNDATSAPEQPLAIGAVALDVYSLTSVIVQMGSVARNCYKLDTTSVYTGSSYNFVTDTLITGLTATGYDLRINYFAGYAYPLTITDAQPVPQPTIAYLGNGELVDFDYVPGPGAFFTDSSLAKGGAPVSLGDIFCLRPSSIPGGYAWVQVTDVGNGTIYQGAKFRYRINTIHPYFAYEQTLPDTLSTCSATW